jgi:hypothetical protein
VPRTKLAKAIYGYASKNARLMISRNRGAAAHGDYVFGWEGNTLQKAMDSGCNLNRDCPAAGLTAQSADKYNACIKPQQAKEPVDGCKLNESSPALPSCLASRIVVFAC